MFFVKAHITGTDVSLTADLCWKSREFDEQPYL